MKNTFELAHTFVAIVRRDVRDNYPIDWQVRLRQIDETNFEYAIAGNLIACASHEHCDANQSMIEACETLFTNFDLDSQEASDQIDEAWALAKMIGFSR